MSPPSCRVRTGLKRRFFAHERELDWFVFAFAQNDQSDLAADGTDQLIEHELIGLEPLHGDTIDVSDDVVGLDARLGRWALVDRRDNFEVPLLRDEFHTEPNQMPVWNLRVAEERPSYAPHLSLIARQTLPIMWCGPA